MTRIILAIVMSGFVATSALAKDIKGATGPEKGLRDPFWPLDYTPPKDVKTPTGKPMIAAPVAQWPKLKLKGVTTLPRGGYLAIIDKVGLVEKGQVIEIKKGKLSYTWKITSISKKGFRSVRLRAVPLK